MRRARIVLYTASVLFIVLIAWTTAVLASDNKSRPDLKAAVSNELDMAFAVAEPEASATPEPTATPVPTATVTPEATPAPTPTPVSLPGTAVSGDGSELLTIVVDNGDGTTLSAAAIRRTKDASGRITDQVTFGAQQAAESVAGAKAAGQTTARIIIPDPADQVSELMLRLPKAALDTLYKGGLDLEIYSDNAVVTIPNASLLDVAEDLFFRLVPIKDPSQRAEVEERARVERIVRATPYGENAVVVARPMTIETNLTSRAVGITLPLLGVQLPADGQEREAFLAELSIFIEHSDGDRELIKPESVQYKQGLLGLSFGINKFSTFTILRMEGSGQAAAHEAYILGYPDGTFRPDRGITRGELAAVLQRLKAQADKPAAAAQAALSDITGKHWPDAAVQYTASAGLMTGYADGTFRPEAYVSRAEFAAMVSRWIGLPGAAEAVFTDTADHWAEAAIGALLQAKLVTGYPDGTFRPGQPLTRAEAVTIINSILQRDSESWNEPSWADVPATHWAFQAIEEASVTHADASGPEAAADKQ